MSRKRKRKEDLESAQQITCFLHAQSLSEHGNFVPLTDVKGKLDEKLEYLMDIRDWRLQEAYDSPQRMQSVCDQIPTIAMLPDDLSTIGYHRVCYQRFTSNLNRLKGESGAKTLAPLTTRSPRKSTSAGPIFPPECIFCETIERKIGKKTERPMKFSSFKNRENGWEQIESHALVLEDHRLHRKVKNKDLFACEAQHHYSCLNSFRTSYSNLIKKRKKLTGKRRMNKNDEVSMTESDAYQMVFNNVLNHIETHIIKRKEIVQLGTLRLLFTEVLAENGHGNPNYRSEKLMNRLQNNPINDHVSFAKVGANKISVWVVYNSCISVSDALVFAYKVSTKDKYLDVALSLHENILQASQDSTEQPWPVTADSLEISDGLLPFELIQFLSRVISGKVETAMSTKMKRLVFSIGQDLCRAVTEGKWLFPKHILLCMTVQHLTRSRGLTTILNRLGHSECYQFGVELETALANALDAASTHLTPQIVKGEGNLVFHCEWDNLNKTTTSVHGNNIVNSAGGIMIQEVKEGYDAPNVRTLPVTERANRENMETATPQTLPPLNFNRVGPMFPDGASFKPPKENDVAFKASMQEYYIWLFSRYIGSSGRQPVPGLCGFTSATGKSPPRKSTVEYFTPIHQPITDNAVVHELLKRSEKATAEVGQKYVLSTFDLGVCMKALPIIWRWPEEFSKHIVMIGPFHTSMNYMGMLTGHKMLGTGYAEIIMEA